jgi:autophagy-related protein 9
MSSRTYTPLAEWQFREFNELPHLFRTRLNMSRPYASHYIGQFPKKKTEMVARIVAFIAGSLATVLAVVTVVDADFFGMEVTPDRNALFYLTAFGGIWALARGGISEENKVFNPEFAMLNVIEWTRHQPDHWQDRLNSYDIMKEFSELYKLRAVVFLEEILSILTVPFVLFSTLPNSSDQIIDFFREFTIHVDGLGYVCSFAEFDFKKGPGASKQPADVADVRDDYYATKHGKMEASYYGFLGNYGNFVLNSNKAGTPSHLHLGMRHPFHPPPAWPSLNSPTLAPENLHMSRMGRSERAPGRANPRTPRFGPAGHHGSPMASILLDPHHQPSNLRSTNPPRQQRAGYQGESNIIEESLEDSGNRDGKREDEEEAYGSGAAMDESAWQTSPIKNLSRENSTLDGREDPDTGVVHMICQLNQAHLTRRPGGLM